jgi:uncharacterized protein YdhG (YjbR/CyaY superfamily)
MPGKKSRKKEPSTAGGRLSKEEIAAMHERVRELRAGRSAVKVDGETEVRMKITEMTGTDRAIAERLHAIIRATAPNLVPRTWYGMPAYSKDGEVHCWYQPAAKFKARYPTLSFGDGAKLDEDHMWPISFALTRLSETEEARIVALLQRSLG